MSEAAEYLLDLPSRQVFGTEIEFLNPKTKRKKLAIVSSIGPGHVYAHDRSGRWIPIPFNSITRITKEAQP